MESTSAPSGIQQGSGAAPHGGHSAGSCPGQLGEGPQRGAARGLGGTPLGRGSWGHSCGGGRGGRRERRALSQLQSRWVAGGAQECKEAPRAGVWGRCSCGDAPPSPWRRSRPPPQQQHPQQHLSEYACAWRGLGGEATPGPAVAALGARPPAGHPRPREAGRRPSAWVWTLSRGPWAPEKGRARTPGWLRPGGGAAGRWAAVSAAPLGRLGQGLCRHRPGQVRVSPHVRGEQGQAGTHLGVPRDGFGGGTELALGTWSGPSEDPPGDGP